MICENCGKEFECKHCAHCTYTGENDCDCDNCFSDQLDENVRNGSGEDNDSLRQERKIFCGQELMVKEKVTFT